MRSHTDSGSFLETAVSAYGPLVVIIAVVFGGIAAKNVLGDLTGSNDTLLFYHELDSDLLDDYAGVIAVAHNAGDSPETARLALEHHADVIEIDVTSSSTTLYAAHSPPKFVVPSALTAMSLGEAWANASGSSIIMLDLKQSSRSFLVRVASFLQSRPASDVIVASRSRSALKFLDREVPQATLLYSAASRAALDQLIGNDDLASFADGVSIASGLLDEQTMSELEARDLIAFAWVVNTIPRVNELLALGVDGIITDNLALLELLGDRGPETLVAAP